MGLDRPARIWGLPIGLSLLPPIGGWLISWLLYYPALESAVIKAGLINPSAPITRTFFDVAICFPRVLYKHRESHRR